MSSAAPPIGSSDPSVPSAAHDNPTSNLYLVTFLATLFLLLFVSCAIVMRSYFLRRRYQRQLEHAMATGMLLTPRAQGSKKKRFGLRPMLIDAWLAAPAHGSKWHAIVPLSAQPVFVKRKYREVPKAVLFDNLSASSSGAPISPGPGPASDTLTNATLSTPISPPPRRIPGFFLPRRQRPSSDDANDNDNDNDIDADADEDLGPENENEGENENEAPVSPVAAAVNVDSVPAITPSAVSADADRSPTASGPAAAGTGTTVKVRVEMLQIAVLIAMPSPASSVAPRGRRHTSKIPSQTTNQDQEPPRERRRVCSLDEDLDEVLSMSPSDDAEIDDEDEDGDAGWADADRLPELVFGVARVNYRQPHRKRAVSDAIPGEDSNGGAFIERPSEAALRLRIEEVFLAP